MKKLLLILFCLSFSFSGTMYFGYDVDDSEILTMGYNHTVKHWTCDETGDPCWILAAGANFDVNSDLMKFASFYLFPMKPVTKKMSVWMSLGYGFLLDDGGFENLMDTQLESQFPGIDSNTELSTGLTYGLGVHYNLNEKMGFGLGKSVNTLDLELSAMGVDFDPELDDLERTNVYFSYKF